MKKKMRIARAVAVLVGVCGFGGLAPTAVSAASAKVRLPDCGNSSYGGGSAPVEWDRGCTGTQDLVAGRWKNWGTSKATGTGRTQIDACDPTCAQGQVTEVPITIIASIRKTCTTSEGKKYLFYTRVNLRFRYQGKLVNETYDLDCQK